MSLLGGLSRGEDSMMLKERGGEIKDGYRYDTP